MNCTCWKNSADGRTCEPYRMFECPEHGILRRAGIMVRTGFSLRVGDFLVQVGLLAMPYGIHLSAINVPYEMRGKGFGSKALERLIETADNLKVPIFLEPSAFNPVDQKWVESWYWRKGFRPMTRSEVRELLSSIPEEAYKSVLRSWGRPVGGVAAIVSRGADNCNQMRRL